MGALEVARLPLSEAAAGFADASMSANTRAAYTSDWADFTHWCSLTQQQPLPADPATLANYLAAQSASRSPATIDRRIAAINKAHQLHGYPPPGAHPAVQTVRAGIRRTMATRPHRMRPLLLDDLNTALAAIDLRHWPAAISGTRDHCLILFGFAGAFRRSELASLRVSDAAWIPSDGLHITVARSKTDQEGVGQVKALPYGIHPETCPACSLHRWLTILSGSRTEQLAIINTPNDGHICREPHPAADTLGDTWLFPPINRHGDIDRHRHISGQSVNDIVRRRISAAGIGPAGWGAHSLRAGFITQALRAGATDAQVMRQSGHRSPATVHIYDRENNPLRGNAVSKLGL